MDVTQDNLNDLMEFDHVIRVHADGSVTEPENVFAPEIIEGDVSGKGWALMNGYSGQCGYSGPHMHPSEFIGGGLARDILATPGDYVALVVDLGCDDDCEEDCRDDHAEGWAVAFRYPAAELCQSVLSDNHSDDVVEIYAGSTTPKLMCGYHASREYPNEK